MKLNGKEYNHITAVPKRRDPIPVIAFIPNGEGEKQESFLFAEYSDRAVLCLFAFYETWEVFDNSPGGQYVSGVVGYVSKEGKFMSGEEAFPDFEQYRYLYYQKRENDDNH